MAQKRNHGEKKEINGKMAPFLAKFSMEAYCCVEKLSREGNININFVVLARFRALKL